MGKKKNKSSAKDRWTMWRKEEDEVKMYIYICITVIEHNDNTSYNQQTNVLIKQLSKLDSKVNTNLQYN